MLRPRNRCEDLDMETTEARKSEWTKSFKFVLVGW